MDSKFPLLSDTPTDSKDEASLNPIESLHENEDEGIGMSENHSWLVGIAMYAGYPVVEQTRGELKLGCRN